MTTKIEAIYENGILRLAEKPALENGARVQVTIQTNGAPQGGSTPSLIHDGETYRVPFDPVARAALDERAKNFDPEKVRAAMERIAALTEDHGEVEDGGENHDYYLYGEGRQCE